MTLYPSLAEPWADIRAQIGYMLDPKSGKRAVFISPLNGPIPFDLPEGVLRHDRADGILLTPSPTWLQIYADAEPLTTGVMAMLLGYPQDKILSIVHGGLVNGQVRDQDGHVLLEAVLSSRDGSVPAFIARAYVPPGGSLAWISPIESLARRQSLMEAA